MNLYIILFNFYRNVYIYHTKGNSTTSVKHDTSILMKSHDFLCYKSLLHFLKLVTYVIMLININLFCLDFIQQKCHVLITNIP